MSFFVILSFQYILVYLSISLISFVSFVRFHTLSFVSQNMIRLHIKFIRVSHDLPKSSPNHSAMFRSVSASLPLSITCYSNRFFTYVFTEYHMRPHSSFTRLLKIFNESSPNLPQIFRTSAASLLEISLKFWLVFFKFSEQVWECGIHNFFWFFFM